MLKQTIAADEEIISNFTGGDSIFYLHFQEGGDVPFEAAYRIEGDHPVPNISLHVTNFSELVEMKEKGLEVKDIRAKAMQERQIAMYWPGTPLVYPTFPFPEHGNGLFRVVIVQPKAVYVEFVLMAKPEWKAALCLPSV